MRLAGIIVLAFILSFSGSLLFAQEGQEDPLFDPGITWSAEGIPNIVGETQEEVLYGQGQAMGICQLPALLSIYARAMGNWSKYWLDKEDCPDDPYSSEWNNTTNPAYQFYQQDFGTKLWKIPEIAGDIYEEWQNDPNCNLDELVDAFRDGIRSTIDKWKGTTFSEEAFNLLLTDALPQDSNLVTSEAIIASGLKLYLLARQAKARAAAFGDNAPEYPDSSDSWVMLDNNRDAWLLIDPHGPAGHDFGGEQEHTVSHYTSFACTLNGPDLHFKGFCTLGSPLLLEGVKIPTGPNDFTVGWAYTTSGDPAMTDAYWLNWDPNLQQYEMQSGWTDLESEDYEIFFKNAPPNDKKTVTAYYTEHGPVVRMDTDEEKLWALRPAWWLGRNQVPTEVPDCARIIEQQYKMITAQSIGEWREAMSIQAVPAGNLVYASNADLVADRIGYYLVGCTPERHEDLQENWEEVIDGSKPDYIWHDCHDFDELPHASCTAQHPYFICCNSSIDSTWPDFSPASFPDYMVRYWGTQTFRGERANELLVPDPENHDKSRVNLDLYMNTATDTYHGAAAHFIPLLYDSCYVDQGGGEFHNFIKAHYGFSVPRDISIALNTLNNWDKMADRESEVMYLFRLFQRVFFDVYNKEYEYKYFGLASDYYGTGPTMNETEVLNALDALRLAYAYWKGLSPTEREWGNKNKIRRRTSVQGEAGHPVYDEWEVSGDTCCLRAAMGHWQGNEIRVTRGQSCTIIAKVTSTSPVAKFRKQVDDCPWPEAPAYPEIGLLTSPFSLLCTQKWANELFSVF